ncbi:hypothetical protein C8F01DRAFT_1139452 [Mycena amicta]|nr:hypothetical protein C8F01DRAFT_1139452 [Mycena amicta]
MSRRTRSTGSFSSKRMPTDGQWNNIHSILRANSHPTGATAAHIRSYIVKAPAELERYDAEMEAVQEILKRLEFERWAVKKYAKMCKSTLAPIRRLPPEVLLEVFRFRSPMETTINDDYQDHDDDDDDVHDFYWDNPKARATPDLLVVAQVCAHWRTLILRTASLWTTFDANFSRRASDDINLRKLALCLGHSGSLPLDVKLSGSYQPLALLLKHVERWRHMDFTLVDSFMDSFMFGFGFGSYLTKEDERFASAAGRVPLLESLRISTDRSLASVTQFEVAPKLTRVAFSDAPPKLPWAQLQHVACEFRTFHAPTTGAELEKHLNFLTLCPSGCTAAVSEVDIHRLSAWAEQPSPTLRGDLSHLRIELLRREMDVETSLRIIGNLFLLLNFPGLRTLHFTSSHRSEPFLPWPSQPMISFATRSPLLSTLFLDNIRITVDQLTAFLAHASAVERLFIQDIESHIPNTEPDHILFTNTLLHTLSDTSLNLLPRLTTLAVAAFFSPAHIDAPILLSFLSSRASRDFCFTFKATIIIPRREENDLDRASRLTGVFAQVNAEHRGSIVAELLSRREMRRYLAAEEK